MSLGTGSSLCLLIRSPRLVGVQPMLPGIEIPPELSEDRVSGTRSSILPGIGGMLLYAVERGIFQKSMLCKLRIRR